MGQSTVIHLILPLPHGRIPRSESRRAPLCASEMLDADPDHAGVDHISSGRGTIVTRSRDYG